jgi:hypothetical protein
VDVIAVSRKGCEAVDVSLAESTCDYVLAPAGSPQMNNAHVLPIMQSESQRFDIFSARHVDPSLCFLQPQKRVNESKHTQEPQTSTKVARAQTEHLWSMKPQALIFRENSFAAFMHFKYTDSTEFKRPLAAGAEKKCQRFFGGIFFA